MIAGAFCSGDDASPRCLEPLTPEALRRILGFDTPFFASFLPVFVHTDVAQAVGVPSYERFEFIGDAVINMLCAKFLYDKFPGEDEGFLTKTRSKLVCTKSLALVSQRLGLARHAVMTAKAFETGFNTNPRVCEDLFEALVGCLYETHGLLEAKRFFLACLDSAYGSDDYAFLHDDENYKDAAMRYCQAGGLPLPTYHVVPPRADEPPGFKCCIMLDGRQAGFGVGGTKKAGEQLAAKRALASLGLLDARGFVDGSKIGRNSRRKNLEADASQ